MKQCEQQPSGRHKMLVTLVLAAFAFIPGIWLAGGATAQVEDPWSPSAPANSPDLDAIATDVIFGEVIAVDSIDAGQSVYRLAEIEIIATERGSLAGIVHVEVPGGTRSSGDEVIVSHQPYLEPGQFVRVLLVEATPQERVDLGVDAYSIVGGIAGVELQLATGNVLSQAQARSDFVLNNSSFSSFPQTFNVFTTSNIPALESIFSGIGAWEIETCSTIDFAFNNFSNDDATDHDDGVNQIGPVIPASPADTYIAEANWSVTADNKVVEWDITYNLRDWAFSPGATVPGTYDWATVTAHEIGHVLGLAHAPSTTEVMWESLPTDTVKYLNSGDIAGATAIYGVNPFVDVASSTYFEEPTMWMYLTGITTGTSATTFSPAQPVTRAQMALFLHRSANSPAVTGSLPFTDIPNGEPYEQAVIWLLQEGITMGTSATTFSPNATVSRAEMATFLHRFADSPAPAGAAPFTDVPGGDWFSDPIAWLHETGITTGTSPTTFSPAADVTRDQMAAFIYRFFGEPDVC